MTQELEFNPFDYDEANLDQDAMERLEALDQIYWDQENQRWMNPIDGSELDVDDLQFMIMELGA